MENSNVFEVVIETNSENEYNQTPSFQFCSLEEVMDFIAVAVKHQEEKYQYIIITK